MMGPLAHRCEPPKGRARPPRPALRAPRGGWAAAARGRGRRQPTGRLAAVATRCARKGHSFSSAMIASGDLICMEGNICISW